MALTDDQDKRFREQVEKFRQAQKEFDAKPPEEQLEIRIRAERFSFKTRWGPFKPKDWETEAWDKIMAYFFFWTEGIETVKKHFPGQVEFVLSNEGRDYWQLKEEILAVYEKEEAEERKRKRELRKQNKGKGASRS